MNKITRCSLIIKDDFNNVLIIQRKVKKGQPKVWSILSRDIKGKETPEKCLEKISKDDLKSIVFDLIHFNDYNINSAYTGIIKESIVLHKDILYSKWINKVNLEDVDLMEDDKKILLDFFSHLK